MKTFRRDKLKRLVEAGRVVCVDSYHYDDMRGSSRGDAKELPVRMMEFGHERQEGVVYLFDSDFNTKSGACWENPDGTVTLIVHSNSNYTFKII